jgi:hypothetical protein
MGVKNGPNRPGQRARLDCRIGNLGGFVWRVEPDQVISVPKRNSCRVKATDVPAGTWLEVEAGAQHDSWSIGVDRCVYVLE